MTSRTRQHAPILILASACAITLLVYWVGLHGPFLFDDGPNLAPLQPWLGGKVALRDILFGNTSWVTYRSLSMSSFALNAWIGGAEPYGFKLVNLLLHLLCGVVGYQLICRLLSLDPAFARHNRLAAALIIAVWLLHPFNASTVLYVVQRMTQLATLFCLLGLWLYVTVRVRMEQGTARRAWIPLFVGIPLLTLAGIQGKQNAAVLPLLCLVVELAYFRRPGTWPRSITTFYAVFLAAPAILAIAALVIRPDLLLAGYGEYAFSPWQRLLSESRVLCDYLRMILAPYSPGMGVYTDDYLPSLGLLSPPTTALACALLLAVSAGAWRVRKTYPSVFAGWFLFLAAHAIESTILPLELYYEHRNYLPMIGLLLACAGLVAALGQKLTATEIRGARIGAVAVTALLAMLALQTHGRARVWSDINILGEAAVRSHPDSARAVINLMNKALEAGNTTYAYNLAAKTIESTHIPATRASVMLYRIRVDCDTQGRSSTTDLDKAVAAMPPHVDLTTFQMFQYVAQSVDAGACEGITPVQLADAIGRAADQATHQAESAWPKAQLRQLAARRFADAGLWSQALKQARLGWHEQTHPAFALLLVEALLREGQPAEAERVYVEAAARSDRSDPRAASGLQRIRTMLDSPASKSP